MTGNDALKTSAFPRSTYQTWLVKEGIPVVRGYAADVRMVSTGPWERRG